LVVDDEVAIRQVLSSQITDLGHQVEHVGTGDAAVRRLGKGDVDIALCDIRLPDISGIEVIKRSVAANADTIFLMMTAYASVNTAIEAMKAGAFDYLIKPVRLEDIELRFSQLSEIMRLREENQRLRRMVPEQLDQVCALGSREARKVERIVSRVAMTEGTVLITGESGTGKGVVARSIHRQSLRSAYPLVEVNCGAIPENLLEAEFFGHLKGAFTGADRAKKGLLREADGGTILLDEIAELPLLLQVKLLHAIEDKVIRPVGGEQSRRIDVRIIAATNKDLETKVKAGEFREDLFYRLNVLNIELLPLRQRREDIGTLLDHFLAQGPKQLGVRSQFSIEPEARRLLISYNWPGNIRQLQNVVHRMLVLSESDTISVGDLPPQIANASQSGGGEPSPSSTDSLRQQSLRFEVSVIRKAIEDSGGDRQIAARKLGIGVSTLYRKLEEYEKLSAT
jgi:two-component system response regulator AtoC